MIPATKPERVCIQYTGQVNERGKMHGRGVMRAFFRGEEIGFREGTFKDDMPEGISVGRDPIHNNIFVNEYKEGRCFGKGTVYKFGKV